MEWNGIETQQPTNTQHVGYKWLIKVKLLGLIIVEMNWIEFRDLRDLHSIDHSQVAISYSVYGLMNE